MSYVQPQVLVHQEFNLVPAEIGEPLRACIIGGHAQLLRYGDDDEQSLGRLGAYNPESDAEHGWPNKRAGAVIDQDYVKVWIKAAKLVLFQDDIGSGETVAPVAGTTNRVRIGGDTGFAENGEYGRIASLLDRDVKKGDRVYVRGVASSVSYELDSYVLDIAGDEVAATVAQPTPDVDNAAGQDADTAVTQTAGTDNNVALTADVTDYNGLIDGYINDTYTVTVTKSSVDGDHTTAEIKLTSASGADDAAAVTPSAAGVAFTAGARGLALTFTGSDNLIAGQTFTVTAQAAFEQPLGVASGTYTGKTSTTYIVEVVKGGLFDADLVNDRPFVVVRTVHGVDSSAGRIRVDGDNTDVAIGTKGVSLQFYGTGAASSESGGEVVSRDPVAGLRKGDKYYIVVTAATEGRLGTLVLGHNLPEAIRDASDLDLQIYITKDVQVGRNRIGYDPLINWSSDADSITIKSGILAYDADYTEDGVQQPLEVAAGTVYVEYRAWLQDYTASVETINDIGDIDDMLSGPLHPDNPLKWGVAKALANSGGTGVKFTAVSDESELNSWSDSLDLLIGRDDVYGLVPLSRDRNVQDLVVAHVDSQSSPTAGRWRVAWLNGKAETESAVISAATSQDNEAVLATIAADPDAAETAYTYLQVSSGNASFVTSEVRPNDIVRVLFQQEFGSPTWTELLVDRVLNEETLILQNGLGAPLTTAEKIEIWHPLSRSEVAINVAQNTGSFANRRVRVVWPDTVTSGNLTYPGYFLCCCLAALRGSMVPHASLTEVEINGISAVDRSDKFFNQAQLNTLAESGTWVVTRDRKGRIYTRHALTSDTTDLNRVSDNVVTNVDSISFLMGRRMAPYIGKSNVTPGTISVLQVELEAALDFLKANGYTARLGGQLIEGKVTEIRASYVAKDRVIAAIALTVPYALNNIEVFLTV